MIYRIKREYKFDDNRYIFELDGFEHNLFVITARKTHKVIDISEHRKDALKKFLKEGPKSGVNLEAITRTKV